ncbi:thiamine pyrophosphate-binding protein, partial [Candidatus Gracilibacteria bacterium]|nr:thiamine pyrophosphate-binding protein [Candidatus Gracilibacteria bacterium]
MKVSDLFVKTLEQNGVEIIYGVPGEENLDFLESLRTSNIKLILTRNEQTAVFMAATYGRLTGKMGVALATLGPGATNMVTGVAYAQLGGMPVMVITGQKPINKSKQGQFQIIDVVAMMKPITKFATSIVSPTKLAYTINNAIKIAESEKPGAVHIELPEDVAALKIAKKDIIDIAMPEHRRAVIDDKMFESLKKELESAKAPVILVGGGANRKRITKYLTKFIEKYNIPYFTSQMGKGVVMGNSNQYLGTAAVTSGDYIHNALAKSDLIVTVGFDASEKPTQVIEDGETKMIHIHFYPTDIDYVYTPYMEAIGDIGNTLWRLCESDLNTKKWNFEKIYKINEKNNRKIEENFGLEDAAPYMMPRRLTAELR